MDAARWSQILGLPPPSPVGKGWLSDDRERVRFVLRARMHSAGISQSKVRPQLTLRGKPVTRNRLSRLLTSGDILVDDLSLVRQLEQSAIHDSATSDFATRIIEWKDLDSRGDPSWWLNEYSRTTHYTRPLDVIVAGLSLTRWANSVGIDYARQHLESAPARRSLAYALCRLATGSFGYAHDAMTVIARLGPVVSEFVAEFIRKSPMGMWVARAADGAIRRASSDPLPKSNKQLFVEYSDAAANMRVDQWLPSRCMSHLRLHRRLALQGDEEQRTGALFQLLHTAENAAAPSRWRRFAFWVLAEPAVRVGSEHRERFDELCRRVLDGTASDGRILQDIAEQLAGEPAAPGSSAHRLGPYARWSDGDASRFDLTVVDHRDVHGAFEWPLRGWPATDALLRRFTLRGYSGGVPEIVRTDLVGSVGPDIRMRLLDILHEVLVHPGFIRVQTYIDVLHAAGDAVFRTVVGLVNRMLAEVLDRGQADVHLRSVLDAMLFVLGRSRLRDGLPILLRAAEEFDSPELIASAVWSIGDVAARSRRERHRINSESRAIEDVLGAALKSPHLVVQRAALHALAVGGFDTAELRWQIRRGFAESPDADAYDWANWCLVMWEPDALSTPPIDFWAQAAELHSRGADGYDDLDAT